jgi:hypothetical protein
VDVLTREDILSALEKSLKPIDEIYALWEAGAVAFNRIDQWSDIDLMVDVQDECVAKTWDVIENTLKGLSPIELRYELPQPAWHGHSQVFYRLQNASPYLFVDAVVMQHSNPNKFLEVEQHGQPKVLFDKLGVTQPPAFDLQALKTRLQEQVQQMKVTFDLFQVETTKELNRGNDIEALSFYYASTIRPLVELLRIRYMSVPARHKFYTRYVQYDLPKEVVEKLGGLFFVRDEADLALKHRQAGEWFQQVIHEFEEGEYA